MKKSYLLLFTLLVPTMISCGGEVNSSQGEIEEFDPNKSYQIDFLGWGGVAEQKNFQTLINKFMGEYPNVKVFYDAISDTTSYSTNLVNRANNLPDVFYVPDWDYIKWADSGKLLDYSEYLSEEEISKLWPASIDIFRFDEKTKTVGTGDKIYGLPKDLGPSAIVYNKTLMQQLIEEYHLDASLPSTTEPMTFSEFKEYLKKFKGLKVDESRITPISYYDLQCAVYSNNTNFYTDDSATISNITDQKFVDAVQFVADLSIEGLASDYASAATSSAFTRFASQECLFSWMGPWDIATFWDGLSFEFDIMPVPKGDAEGAKSTTTIGTVAYSVSNASKNKPAAVLLAKWLACSETSATMNYKLGQAMPNIKQMAEDDWVNNKDLTGIYTYPESKSVFVDSIKGTSNMTGKSRAYYYTYEKTAYDDLMDQFNSVWSGQKSAKEVIDSYAQTFQDKLTKIHKNLE